MRPSPPAAFGRIKARPPFAAPGQVIGLLGGSFNPPHVAHRMISEVALKRLGLDKVWWIVSPGNPLKKRTDNAPLAERLVLCREVAKNPHIIVTDFEADLKTPYTASTLAFLKTRTPLVRYVWIMGADNLATFDRWQRWREIFTMVPVVVVDRPGWRMKALASKAARAFASSRIPESEASGLATHPAPAWTFLTGPLSHVSSTALRNKGSAAATLLPGNHSRSASHPGKSLQPKLRQGGAVRPLRKASPPGGLEREDGEGYVLVANLLNGKVRQRRAGLSFLVQRPVRTRTGLMTKGQPAQYADRTRGCS